METIIIETPGESLYENLPDLLFSIWKNRVYFNATYFIHKAGEPVIQTIEEFTKKHESYFVEASLRYDIPYEELAFTDENSGYMFFDGSLLLLFIAFINPLSLFFIAEEIKADVIQRFEFLSISKNKRSYIPPKFVLIFDEKRTLSAIMKSLYFAANCTLAPVAAISFNCTGKYKSTAGFYFRHKDPKVKIKLRDIGVLGLEEYDRRCGENREYHPDDKMLKNRVNFIEKHMPELKRNNK